MNKLLSRISLCDSSYGITSDPLTQFACTFSALVHDAGHTGVTNAVLIKENSSLASTYKGKSVAEQNSVDMAWGALAMPEYEQLRSCIFVNKDELRRFRQLLVNSVIATDIFDKEQGALRKKRWNKAFEGHSTESARNIMDRKATIVIEHLIQTSDVAHTMQHFTINVKWNSLLFQETYKAYLARRTDSDPSEGWYQGELWFFDNYVIPLAKKLQECGVFGVSGDEYLNYAIENRREWEAKGEHIVRMIVEKSNPD